MARVFVYHEDIRHPDPDLERMLEEEYEIIVRRELARRGWILTPFFTDRAVEQRETLDPDLRAALEDIECNDRLVDEAFERALLRCDTEEYQEFLLSAFERLRARREALERDI